MLNTPANIKLIPALLHVQIFHDLLVPFFYLLRITKVFPDIGHVEKIFFVLNVSLILQFLLSKWSSIKFTVYALVPIFIVVYGVTISAFFPFEARYYIPAFSTMILAVVGVLAGYNCGSNHEVLVIMERYYRALIVSFLIGFAIYFILKNYFGFAFYPSFVVQMLFLPCIFALVTKKYWSLVFIVGLMLVAGKRGPTIAMLLTIVIYFASKNIKSFIFTAFSSTIFVSAFVVLLSVSSLSTFQKYQYFLGNDESASNVELLTSGRDVEALGAYSKVEANDAVMSGMGFSFNHTINYLVADDETRGYVHVSPFNFLLRFGIFAGSIFVFFVYIYPFLRLGRLHHTHVSRKFLGLLFFALLFNSLTAYTIAYESFFWVSLGVLLKRVKRLPADCSA